MAVDFLISLLSVSVCVIMTIVTAKERVYYADFERTNVTYWNPKYYVYVNASARRYGRGDLVHYLNFHYETLVPMGNNVTIDIYVYEFLSNEYRRSFVEMHYKACDLAFGDKIFGNAYVAAVPKVYRKCPFPKGVYHVENVSYPDLPVLQTFPFRKGRVYVNFTVPKANELLVAANIDLAIKSRWR